MQIKNNISEPLPKLELDKNRFRVKYCPCGKSNKDGKFVPYKGYEDKGYCHSCGEIFRPELPEKEFELQSKNNIKSKSAVKPQPKPVSFIPVEVFKQSLKSYDTNNFIKFLINLFGVEITNELISKYFIGTSKHWNGATVFWQIDISGKIRTGKIMLYSPTTGKRVKEPFNHINWVHQAIKQPEFELQQCLFGEHLLQDKTKPIAIVESEKTALIASVYFPQCIWLATSGADGLSIDKCETLNKHNQPVILFPDISKPKEDKETTFEKWVKIANKRLLKFTFSDLLESNANDAERQQGLDLADYLIRFDYNSFQQPEQPEQSQKEFEQPLPKKMEQVQALTPIEKTYFFKKPDTPQQDNWEQDINELEQYFKTITLTTQPIKLNQCTTILNVLEFIESHLAFVKANNGKRSFLPYLNRLQELKKYLTINLN